MAEDDGTAIEPSKGDSPPQNPKPDNVGCFSGMSCFVMFWLVGYFVLGGMAIYPVMFFAALIAAAFLILTHIGEVDMIFVFRPSEKQIQAAAEKGLEFKITPIGYDAFIFFVNAKNPVAGLTMEQLKDIYSGKITRWSEVGGIAWKIVPFQRSEGSGSQSRMLQFMGETPLLPAEKETTFFSMYNIVHTARYHNYRGAIGYSFLYFVDQMILAQGIKLLKVDGVPPTLASIRDGTYPLTEEICVVTAGSDNPNVEPFIEWMLSPQGQGLVEKVGYIPINAPATPKAGQAEK